MRERIIIPTLMILGVHFSNRLDGTIVVASEDIFVEHRIELSRRNSENIPLFIRDIFISNNRLMSDLSCIGVVVGPGALTPLRLSVATVQTLGLVLQMPVIELSAFEVYLVEEWMTTQLVILEGRGKRLLVQGFSCSRNRITPLFGYIEQDISQVIRLIQRFNVPIGVVTNTALIVAQLKENCPFVEIRYKKTTGQSMVALIKRYQGISHRSNTGVDYAYSPV